MYIDDVAIDITSISRGGKHNRIQSLHTDRLGSTVGVFNTSGYLHESRSYDAFGTPRGSLNSDRFNAILGSTVSPRGFTQHEHLDGAQLIHMNGRVYDYHLGRFLSVDPFIQGVGNSQGVNPYSYILNNPLAGTDPSGYVVCDSSKRLPHCGEHGGVGSAGGIVEPIPLPHQKYVFGADGQSDNGSSKHNSEADNASVASGNVSGIGGQAQVGTSQEVIKHSSWGIWDSIQAGLDVAGLVPIIGELADLTNAGISLARGDYEGAVLSLSAMVPIVGNAAGTAKIIRSAEKFTDSNIVTKKAPEITKPYKRPSGATTKAQRESVQGKSCVDCGATTPKQYADHKDPLVKEYYRTGSIDKTRMRDVDSVQPQCPTCSNKQGAELSRFSRQQKKDLGL